MIRVRRQVITWTIADLMSIGSSEINFNPIHPYPFEIKVLSSSHSMGLSASDHVEHQLAKQLCLVGQQLGHMYQHKPSYIQTISYQAQLACEGVSLWNSDSLYNLS